MEENLVGYLLNALDDETQREVEQYLRTAPEAQRRLELLRQAMRPLEADQSAVTPPLGLVRRTVARCRRGADVLPLAPPISPAVVPAWWRRGDVLVAAGLLICVVGLGAPGIMRLRGHYASRQECSNNMRSMHQALVNYGQLRDGRFPLVEERQRRDVAGIFVPILHDAGLLSQDVSVRCPANGQRSLERWSLDELDALSPEEFQRVSSRLAGCYAYSLGYRDERGQLQAHRIDDEDEIPLLADRPHDSDLRASSPNHNGQNILYVGGQVRFTRSANAGKNHDHIYLNRMNKVAAGLDHDDTVLGASADRP